MEMGYGMPAPRLHETLEAHCQMLTKKCRAHPAPHKNLSLARNKSCSYVVSHTVRKLTEQEEGTHLNHSKVTTFAKGA